jgi:hypothetical protein
MQRVKWQSAVRVAGAERFVLNGGGIRDVRTLEHANTRDISDDGGQRRRRRHQAR